MPRTKKPKKKLNLRYLRRIERGIAKGLTRQEARGHGRPPKASATVIDPAGKLERALRQLKKGVSLKKAATESGIASERLRAYAAQHTSVTRERGRLRIVDQRPRQFPIYSQGALRAPTLSMAETTRASHYLNAVDYLINEGEADRLDAFRGQGVTDVKGAFLPFETDENMLHRLTSAGELYFPEFYKITSGEA